MPPTSDGLREYTVGCRLDKLVPDAAHVAAIESAVHRIHKATFLATELANMHARRCIRDGLDCKDLFHKNNWLKFFYEVTSGGKFAPIESIHQTKVECMPPFDAPDRKGLSQALKSQAHNIVAVATNNVKLHFATRVRSHVYCKHWIAREEFDALSPKEKKDRKTLLLQLSHDMIKPPSEAYESPASRHQWVAAERARLGIDAAMGDWKKPLVYQLEATPHRFLPAMAIMSKEREDTGGKAFALFPLRRSHVPRHVHFDQLALRELLCLGSSDYQKQQAKKQRVAKKGEGAASSASPVEDNIGMPPLGPCGFDSEEGEGSRPPPPQTMPVVSKKRDRRTPEDLIPEKRELLSQVVDLRAAKVKRSHQFNFTFSTDGVCARVHMKAPEKSKAEELTSMPTRGRWSIDQLKHVSRLEQLHVVGIDPGKHEIVVGIDMDDPKGCMPVRYTQKQRQFETCFNPYKRAAAEGKPSLVKESEEQLSDCNSRSADLDACIAYCAKRHERLDLSLAFYADVGHRKRRWKTCIKTQQSEERLYERLEGIRKKGDRRTLVLAYGSWGLVAGKPGMACNKGIPSTIGVGMMKKLAKRFMVTLTPEAYTSKTCCRCLGECGPWKEIEAVKKVAFYAKQTELARKAVAAGKPEPKKKRFKGVRGLRLCQTETCNIPLNRDRNGATNIGMNFQRLFEGRGPIRSMTPEDLQLHRLSRCFQCD